jgi:hypothetical protein
MNHRIDILPRPGERKHGPEPIACRGKVVGESKEPILTLWHALAYVAEMLPQPHITRNQFELMQLDSVASPGAQGFDDLRISSTSLEDVLAEIVGQPASAR